MILKRLKNIINVRVITGVLTTTAMVLGIVWYYKERDFEPAIAAIAGIIAFITTFKYSFLSFDKNIISDRIALIVGNQDYPNAPLQNSINDIEAVCVELKNLGFKIIKKINPKKIELEKAIYDFSTILSTGGVGVFYYAGHAAQIEGHDMILPIDFEYNTGKDVLEKAINLDLLLAPVDKIIEDHPENNGSLVIYSTASGGEAMDGDGNSKHSPFAEVFLELINKWNLEIFDLFRILCQKLSKKTNGHQIPWLSATLDTEFYFKPLIKENIGVFKVLVFDACRNNPFHRTQMASSFQDFALTRETRNISKEKTEKDPTRNENQENE